jgi:hypothetical protein
LVFSLPKTVRRQFGQIQWLARESSLQLEFSKAFPHQAHKRFMVRLLFRLRTEAICAPKPNAALKESQLQKMIAITPDVFFT